MEGVRGAGGWRRGGEEDGGGEGRRMEGVKNSTFLLSGIAKIFQLCSQTLQHNMESLIYQ